MDKEFAWELKAKLSALGLLYSGCENEKQTVDER